MVRCSNCPRSMACVVSEHTESIRDIYFAPECNSLLSCSFDGQLLVWDYPSKTVKKVQNLFKTEYEP